MPWRAVRGRQVVLAERAERARQEQLRVEAELEAKRTLAQKPPSPSYSARGFWDAVPSNPNTSFERAASPVTRPPATQVMPTYRIPPAVTDLSAVAADDDFELFGKLSSSVPEGQPISPKIEGCNNQTWGAATAPNTIAAGATQEGVHHARDDEHRGTRQKLTPSTSGDLVGSNRPGSPSTDAFTLF